MNKKQKIILYIGLLLIVAAIVAWQLHGGEIFTKTQVLVEVKDELFGTTYNEWKDQFVLGLDYTGGFIGVVVVAGGILLFALRTKKQKS